MNAEINDLQKNIMLFVTDWVKQKKTTVPKQEIIKRMTNDGVKFFTTDNAINALLKKGYIRKSAVPVKNTSYVMLRGVNY